ncbi:MAG: CRISPR-associated endonuclease Cas2 [Nitrososphaerota archaeon]
MKTPYLICYDVREEKRLRKTAKIMEGYGKRIQYSIFYCNISTRNLEKLRYELGKILEKEDDLLVIPLCKSCSIKLRTRNPRYQWDDESVSFIVV